MLHSFDTDLLIYGANVCEYTKCFVAVGHCQSEMNPISSVRVLLRKLKLMSRKSQSLLALWHYMTKSSYLVWSIVRWDWATRTPALTEGTPTSIDTFRREQLKTSATVAYHIYATVGNTCIRSFRRNYWLTTQESEASTSSCQTTVRADSGGHSPHGVGISVLCVDRTDLGFLISLLVVN